MSFGLKILSFDGHDINDSTYWAYFLPDDNGMLGTMAAVPVETTRPGKSGMHAFMQPTGLDFFVEIQMLVPSLSDLDTLKLWFDPLKGPRYLIAEREYGEGDGIRLLCTVHRLRLTDSVSPMPQEIFKIDMRAVDGIWEYVDPDNPNDPQTDTETITSTGQTFVIPNAGNANAWPVFTITPNSLKDHADDFIARRRVIAASRTDVKDMDDPMGDGYPFEISGGGLDTQGLFDDGKLLASLNDLRLMNNSEEIYRYLDDEALASGTKVWGNITVPTRRQATLAASIDESVTALAVSNPDGLGGWPDSDILTIDDEAIIYRQRTATTMPTLVRGALNTTPAAHLAGASLHRVRHRDLNLVYDWTGAQPAVSPIERQPKIDLAASSNAAFFWPDSYFNALNGRRSMAWQRYFTDDNPGSAFLRLFETAGVMKWENAYPEAGKPRANNAVFDSPCGISKIVINTVTAVGTVPIEGAGYNQIDTVVQFNYNTLDGAAVGPLLTTTTVLSTTTFVAVKGQEYEHQTFYPLGGDYDPPPILRTTSRTFEKVPKVITGAQSLIFRKYVVDYGSYESILGGTTPGLEVFRARLNVEFPVGLDESGNPFDTIPVTAEANGAYVTAGDIEIDFVASRCPKILLAPEEPMYLLQARLKNDTTGYYLDFVFAMAVGESVVVDCGARTFTDMETGFRKPFAIVASHSDWPFNQPGNNTWSWTEVGVVDTTVVWAQRDRYQ